MKSQKKNPTTKPQPIKGPEWITRDEIDAIKNLGNSRPEYLTNASPYARHRACLRGYIKGIGWRHRWGDLSKTEIIEFLEGHLEAGAPCREEM